MRLETLLSEDSVTRQPKDLAGDLHSDVLNFSLSLHEGARLVQEMASLALSLFSASRRQHLLSSGEPGLG
jgi:hypothetical protein